MEVKKIKKWKLILGMAMIAFSAIIVWCYVWTIATFGPIPFAQVIFHLMVPMEGADSAMMLSLIGGAVALALLVLIVFLVPFIPELAIYKKYRYRKAKKKFKKHKDYFEKKRRCKRRRRVLQKARVFYIVHFLPFSIIIAMIAIIFDVEAFGIDKWLADRFDSNTIFEDYYVDSSEAKIKFPEEKKNLIFILSESLEASFASEQYGGYMDKNYIPYLTKLYLENTHFSSSDNMMGATEVEGTSWTVASMVAHTAGVPLIMPIGDNSYGRYEEFLPGVTSMGEVLAEEGYVNKLIMGSESEFSGIDTYFTQHGNYDIFDYNTAIDKGLIDEDYYEFWGVEDAKLFEYAKAEIEELSSSEQPFNVIINTIDLHTPSGYKCHLCGKKYSDKYHNVIACQDQQIYNFVQWVKEQDFYEDTVIVIAGDHRSMAPRVSEEYITDEDYERTTYHVIINSDVEAINTTDRVFSTMDMYPTILASLGCDIEGDRLGIGTNLYSDTPTVMEVMGKEIFMKEISKNSILYNEDILGIK